MIGIYAYSVATEVIEFCAGWYRSDKKHISEAMGANRAIVNAQHPVTRTV
jgi:hypothetical protein